MKFKKAVESATPPLNLAYKPGLQALMKAHSRKVCCDRAVNNTITGSIDIDAALAKSAQYASENRIDYGIGYKPEKGNECAVWVEVHSANDQEVGTLVRKVQRLKEYLKANAQDLWNLTILSPVELRYVWLGTKNVHLSKNDPAFRRAMQEGITPPRRMLRLP